MTNLSTLDANFALLLYIHKNFPHFDARYVVINDESSDSIHIQAVGKDIVMPLSLNKQTVSNWIDNHYLAILPIKTYQKEEQYEADQQLHDALLTEAFDQIDHKLQDSNNNEKS